MLTERTNKGLHAFAYTWLWHQIEPAASWPVLDVGCGSGAWLKRFADDGFTRLLGLDLDTRQFALPNAEASRADVDGYRDEVYGSFGLVTALELIEHLANPGLLFELAYRNLQPGGYLFITTPNIHSLPARIRFLAKGRLNHFDNKSDPTHIYPVYIENLYRLAGRYGFEVQACSHFPQQGYITYRGATVWLSRLTGLFFPAGHPGDNLLFLLKKIG